MSIPATPARVNMAVLSGLRRAWAWFAARPWWLQVLAVYLVSRLWAGAIFLAAARQQPATGWSGANPDYFTYVGHYWDGEWYQRIAEGGYPAQLPVNSAGVVQQNEWAFFPLFPALGRVLMSLTGLPWEVVAPTLAVILGALAMLVIDRLTQHCCRPWMGNGRRAALGTVALVCFFPSAPVLQAAYTESLALLLIALSLYLIVHRHYLWAIPVVLALGFTRAVALPIAVVVVVHAWVRWRRGHRQRPRPAEWVTMGVLTVVCVISGFIWQIVTGLVTGQANAYFATQSAWRAGDQVVPIEPWFTIAQWLFGSWWPLVILAVIAIGLILVASKPAWRIGAEPQVFAAAYLLYLFGVTEPGTSLARFLILAFPLATVTVTAWRSRAYVGILLLAYAALEIVWVIWLWQLTGTQGWPP